MSDGFFGDDLTSSNPYRQVFLLFAPIVGPPTPGYKARLIILGTLVALTPFLATVLLVLHVMTQRRKGEKVWLYKRVRRERGRWARRCGSHLSCY